MEKDLKRLSLSELEKLAVSLGQKKYVAKYIFSFIHNKGVNSISEITTLSKSFREQLGDEGYYISTLKLVEKFTDPDGTIKYLFELADGGRIESVLLFDDERRTLCISCQVGCAMGCTFCATAKIPYQRNLTAGEIVEQVYEACRENSDVTNVVYMGMGEPFNNYDEVLRSVRLLNDAEGKNIGLRHLTISTCGICEGILRLADEDIGPRLAVSLNGPSDPIREKLMPINKKYPLKKLLEAIMAYQRKRRLRVTFEYVMIAGLNDKTFHANLLVKRLKGIRCNINLIEYNSHAGCKFAASGKEAMERFAGALRRGGIETIIREKKGQSINAACGQLGAEWLTK